MDNKLIYWCDKAKSLLTVDAPSPMYLVKLNFNAFQGSTARIKIANSQAQMKLLEKMGYKIGGLPSKLGELRDLVQAGNYKEVRLGEFVKTR